MNEKTATPLCR